MERERVNDRCRTNSVGAAHRRQGGRSIYGARGPVILDGWARRPIGRRVRPCAHHGCRPARAAVARDTSELFETTRRKPSLRDEGTPSELRCPVANDILSYTLEDDMKSIMQP